MARSAYKNKQRKWVIPQVYFQYHGNGKTISRKKILEKIASNTLLQEACQIDPTIQQLVEEAKRERCVPGYSANDRFYDYYKPIICRHVGWESPQKELRSMQHYDAVYEAIYELLPGDEADIYPSGIMPDGRYCPSFQQWHEREYP